MCSGLWEHACCAWHMRSTCEESGIERFQWCCCQRWCVVRLLVAAVRPAATHYFCTAGSQRYQHRWVSFFSTEHQHTQQDVSLLDPALQKQWDHAQNAHFGNTVIKPHSNQKAWWRCYKCPDGHLHSWSATVNHRSSGVGCPLCVGHRVCKHNSLATRAPKVAAQWDYERNDGTPDSVLAQSNQMYGWRCDVCGHKWSAAPTARVSKGNTLGCPWCAVTKKNTKHPTFAECNHPLLAEWDHERNARQGNRPDNVSLRSCKQIFWLCIRCPAGQEHSWSATPGNRLGHNMSGCPCAGKAACSCNSLQALYPETAAEWDHSKNQPSAFTARSSHSVWWSSPQRGSWQQSIYARIQVQDQRTAKLTRARAALQSF